RLGGCEVVRPVEVHRIDLIERNEPGDVDRARVVVLLDRFEVGVFDDDELALRNLPALDDLVGADLTLLGWAPALLADRGLALPMERPEADIRLFRLGRRR